MLRDQKFGNEQEPLPVHGPWLCYESNLETHFLKYWVTPLLREVAIQRIHTPLPCKGPSALAGVNRREGSDHCRGLDILPHRSEGKGKAVVHINWHAIQGPWLTLIWKGKTPAFVYLDTNYFCLIVHSKPNPHWLQTSKIHVCGAYMIIPGIPPTISERYSDRSLTDGSEDTSSF